MTHANPHGTVQHGQGIDVLGSMDGAYAEILTRQALAFVAMLERRYRSRRRELIVLRADRQTVLDRGERPDFLPRSDLVREGTWRVAPPPPDILDRRVEITGPVDRKMIINALNSGANVFMAE